jgi:hypothetical protein
METGELVIKMNTPLQIGDIVRVNDQSEMFCGKVGKIIRIGEIYEGGGGNITIKLFNSNSTKNTLVLFSYKFSKVSDNEAMLLMLEN